jgi:hypothetical protein
MKLTLVCERSCSNFSPEEEQGCTSMYKYLVVVVSSIRQSTQVPSGSNWPLLLQPIHVRGGKAVNKVG